MVLMPKIGGMCQCAFELQAHGGSAPVKSKKAP